MTTPKGKGKSYLWLLEHVDYQGEDCLKWPFGGEKKSGRGCLGVNGVAWWAHRLMCVLAHGEPPTPKHTAAHACGKGHEGCVNPRHLSWKTQGENMADCKIHGTQPKQFNGAKGRLKPAEVECIRLLRGTRTQFEVAEMFDVSEGAVNDIWRGRSHAGPGKINFWAPEEDQKIREAISMGYTIPKVAEHVGRTASATTARVYKLGLRSKSGVNQKIQP